MFDKKIKESWSVWVKYLSSRLLSGELTSVHVTLELNFIQNMPKLFINEWLNVCNDVTATLKHPKQSIQDYNIGKIRFLERRVSRCKMSR